MLSFVTRSLSSLAGAVIWVGSSSAWSRFARASASMLAAALGLIFFSAAVRGDVVRIGVDMTSKPLSFLDANGKPEGYTKDLFHYLAIRTGIQFELMPDYWANQLRGLENGTLQAVANALVTAERGVVLMVQAADCVPVLLADPERKVVGAVHAGRPGLVAGVVVAASLELLLRDAESGNFLVQVDRHLELIERRLRHRPDFPAVNDGEP